MKKILVFAGSNSKQSINKELATYAAGFLADVQIQLLDLNDFPLPIYSVDLEREQGFPKPAVDFLQTIKESDAILISLAEHNGTYTAVFKNLLDWLSRIESECFQNKPMLLLATSPGQRGGFGVLTAAIERFPRHGAQIIETFTLPTFRHNFISGKLVNDSMQQQLLLVLRRFESSLHKPE